MVCVASDAEWSQACDLEVCSVVRNSIGTINMVWELTSRKGPLKHMEDGDQVLKLFIPSQIGWPPKG